MRTCGLAAAALAAAPLLCAEPALLTMRHGGRERTYRFYRPAKAERGRPAPLVLVLHGAGGDSARVMRTSGFNAVADAEGFLAAYPEGWQRHWNDLRGIPEWPAQRENVDDPGFFSALIDKLVAGERADPRRVYVAGISNGGLMSHRLGCELAGKVAAIAPVVRTLTGRLAERCRPARPVPVLMFFGTADKLVPFEGGLQKMGSVESPVLSARETIRKWAELDGCGEARTEKADTIEHIRYPGCRGGAEVEAYIREGAGHTWPPEGAATIWRFVSRFARD